MKTYTTDKIRNVVLLGHGGAGKTSLVEAMAYLSGITSRLGNVADGSTVSDFGKEEQKRGISLSSSVVPIEWDGYKINILDITQTILSGNFVMMMMVELKDADIAIDELRTQMEKTATDMGVDINIMSEKVFSAMHRV